MGMRMLTGKDKSYRRAMRRSVIPGALSGLDWNSGFPQQTNSAIPLPKDFLRVSARRPSSETFHTGAVLQQQKANSQTTLLEPTTIQSAFSDARDQQRDSRGGGLPHPAPGSNSRPIRGARYSAISLNVV